MMLYSDFTTPIQQKPKNIFCMPCIQNIIYNEYASREVFSDCKFIRKFNNQLAILAPAFEKMLLAYTIEIDPLISNTSTVTKNDKGNVKTNTHSANTHKGTDTGNSFMNRNYEDTNEQGTRNTQDSTKLNQNNNINDNVSHSHSHTLNVHSDTPVTMLDNEQPHWIGSSGDGNLDKGRDYYSTDNANPWYNYASNADNNTNDSKSDYLNRSNSNSFDDDVTNSKNYTAGNQNGNSNQSDMHSNYNDSIDKLKSFLNSDTFNLTESEVKECNDILDNLLKYINFYSKNPFEWLFSKLEKYFLGVF